MNTNKNNKKEQNCLDDYNKCFMNENNPLSDIFTMLKTVFLQEIWGECLHNELQALLKSL